MPKLLAWAVAPLLLPLPALAETQPATISPIAAYMLLGPDGQRIARVVTEIKDCPALFVDGKVVAMKVRVPAGTVPQRPKGSKPSAFPATVCDAEISPDARDVSVHGWHIYAQPKVVNKIVVIGDTGCRIKGNDVQPCNDPKGYPFAAIAQAAASWKPDLVVHVGDYLYREDSCPQGDAVCAGTPWGYGLDAWRADFLDPAQPLLKVAPWIAVRGNHESCNRAGQGWRRLLDTAPFQAETSCDDPANDVHGDFSVPYAVPIGDGAQIVNWDTSDAGFRLFAQGDPHIAAYAANIGVIAELAKKAAHTILTNHHPVLGVAAFQPKTGPIVVGPNNLGLAQVLGQADPKLYPAGIDLLLSGHVHVFEQLSFGGEYPSQFVTGFSGTLEDIVPLPEMLPDKSDPVPGATPDAFSSWIDGFGFMTMERTGPAAWKADIRDRNGTVVDSCTIDGRVSKCTVPQVHVH